MLMLKFTVKDVKVNRLGHFIISKCCGHGRQEGLGIKVLIIPFFVVVVVESLCT